MPSFSDSAVIFVLALLLFGPKKLPELARYVGKLMGEFRRASSEFRLQMEDEFRVIEQAEQQKKIAAIEAAAPIAAIPEPEHPHLPTVPAPELTATEELSTTSTETVTELNLRPEPSITVQTEPVEPEPPNRSRPVEPVAIASNGDLHLMPPATGLPVARSASIAPATSLNPMFDSIPHTEPEPETSAHG